MIEQVVITRIPIIGLPELQCFVQTTDDGRTCDRDGEPIPHERRPRRCPEDGRWMFGAVAVCQEHFEESCRLGGIDPDEVWNEIKEMYGW